MFLLCSSTSYLKQAPAGCTRLKLLTCIFRPPADTAAVQARAAPGSACERLGIQIKLLSPVGLAGISYACTSSFGNNFGNYCITMFGEHAPVFVGERICTAESTAKLHNSNSSWGMFSKFYNTIPFRQIGPISGTGQGVVMTNLMLQRCRLPS